MRRSPIPLLVCAMIAGASLVGCAGRSADQAAGRAADASTMPNRDCNPALVVNPAFLSTNEGIAGAGGPDLPGAGAATSRNCR